MGRKKVYENDAARQAARRRVNGAEERNKISSEEHTRRRLTRDQITRLALWRNRPIIGIDGEGRDTETGDHIFTLLAMGDEKRTAYIENARGLSPDDCFTFLFDTHTLLVARLHKKPLYVIFAGSYDFTMMVKGLGKASVRSLYENGTTIEYFNGDRFHIRVMPRKLMQITRWQGGKKDSLTIYDVFGFFQTSFVKTLIDWQVATPEELEDMATMKGKRDSFTVEDMVAIRSYNESEIVYLVKLVQKLRDALDTCGMYIPSWHGAGAIAGQLMKEHGVKRHIIQTWEEPLETAIKTAYFGGRIQLLQSGMFPHIYAHDIVSAYPSAHVELPSLLGARLTHVDKWYDVKWSLWRVSWRLKDNTPIQPFPLRENGNIYYEQCGTGWYWYPEVAAALEHFGDAITIHEGYVFRTTDETPFNYIRELFLLRKAYKAAGNAAEKPLKLGYNSHYGKHAQHSERGATALPTYQCYWYAGYITSVCRSRILDICMRNPRAVIAIATDGVFATEKLTYFEREGSNLGEWEVNEHENFFIVQPGLYRYEDNGTVKTKTRGLHPSEVDWDSLMAPFIQGRTINPSMEIPVKTQRFIGIKTACARGKLETMGTWDRSVRHIALMLHPTRALSNGKIHTMHLTYYGRLDDGDWQARTAHVSEPFSGRYDVTNGTAYLAELCEIDDNPELYNGD